MGVTMKVFQIKEEIGSIKLEIYLLSQSNKREDKFKIPTLKKELEKMERKLNKQS